MIGRRREAAAVGSVGPLPDAGQAIWIENTRVGPVQSRALEVRDGMVRIDPPRSGGAEVPLPLPQVRLSYQVAQVPCEARAVPRDGTWLDVVSVERMQRRRAVRVPVVMMARVLADEDEEAGEGGVTEDLSANGVLLRLTEPLQVNAVVRIVLHLGGAVGDIDLRARVVRADHEPESARPWRIALTFPDIERAVEDRLVRFLFERQRELRRREGGN